MKTVPLESLGELGRVELAQILSLTPSLYTLRLIVAGEVHRVLENGASVTRDSAEKLKNLCADLDVEAYRLVHSSACDEMVGQPTGEGNLLEIPVAAPVSGLF